MLKVRSGPHRLLLLALAAALAACLGGPVTPSPTPASDLDILKAAARATRAPAALLIVSMEEVHGVTLGPHRGHLVYVAPDSYRMTSKNSTRLIVGGKVYESLPPGPPHDTVRHYTVRPLKGSEYALVEGFGVWQDLDLVQQADSTEKVDGVFRFSVPPDGKDTAMGTANVVDGRVTALMVDIESGGHDFHETFTFRVPTAIPSIAPPPEALIVGST